MNHEKSLKTWEEPILKKYSKTDFIKGGDNTKPTTSEPGTYSPSS